MMSPRDQAETLLNELMAFAEKMLTEHGELFPLAGVVDRHGECRHLAARDGDQHPPPDAIRQMLVTGLQEQAKRDECQLAALITNVSVTDPESGQGVDAIHAAVEHRAGYHVDAYFPYTLSDGILEYGETVVEQRTPEFFLATTDRD